MSQKQNDHRNHYVSALPSMPEDETRFPSNVTPIEDLGISLLDDEAKTLDSDEECKDEAKTLDSDEEAKTLDSDEEEVSPAELKAEFFGLIAELQRKFPEYNAANFKKYLEEDSDMAEQLQTLKDNFHENFKDVDKGDPEYMNLLIGLSSIGVEIPKEPEDEPEDEGGDEGDDEVETDLTKSVTNIELDEDETDV
jgi:hypothetical protein